MVIPEFETAPTNPAFVESNLSCTKKHQQLTVYQCMFSMTFHAHNVSFCCSALFLTKCYWCCQNFA